MNMSTLTGPNRKFSITARDTINLITITKGGFGHSTGDSARILSSSSNCRDDWIWSKLKLFVYGGKWANEDVEEY